MLKTALSLIKPVTRGNDYLRLIAKYERLTAAQVNRRFHSPGSWKETQKRIAALVQEKLLTFDQQPTTVGRHPYIYRLDDLGRRYCDQELGIETRRVYPLTSRDNIDHHLQATDFLIAAELLTEQIPQIATTRLFTERDLSRDYFVTSAEGARRVAVQPDGYIDFRYGGFQDCISLELDRGSEEEKHWRRKVDGIVQWWDGGKGSYAEKFGTDALQVAVVVTTGYHGQSKEKRADDLLTWTEKELLRLGKEDWGALFKVAPIIPTEVTPEELFLEPSFAELFTRKKVPLLTP